MTKKEMQEIDKMINDVRYQLLDKIDKLTKPTEVCVNATVGKDYPKETYNMVKSLCYDFYKQSKEKDIEKMEQEKKYLEERINNTKISLELREYDYFRN